MAESDSSESQVLQKRPFSFSMCGVALPCLTSLCASDTLSLWRIRQSFASQFAVGRGTLSIITEEEVAHVAYLARLELTEEERKLFTTQLDSILGHFRRLQELDTEGVPPTSHAINMENVLRDDVVTESLPVEDVLANAPHRDGDFFLVPRIVET
jgi:aspartyl-tRNA(Asn)/glutamyl-tRNA(Gln) amidotransferase subunit C